MKQVKVKTTTRKTKSGKTVVVKAHTRKDDRTAAAKPGAGSELANKKTDLSKIVSAAELKHWWDWDDTDKNHKGHEINERLKKHLGPELHKKLFNAAPKFNGSHKEFHAKHLAPHFAKAAPVQKSAVEKPKKQEPVKSREDKRKETTDAKKAISDKNKQLAHKPERVDLPNFDEAKFDAQNAARKARYGTKPTAATAASSNELETQISKNNAAKVAQSRTETDSQNNNIKVPKKHLEKIAAHFSKVASDKIPQNEPVHYKNILKAKTVGELKKALSDASFMNWRAKNQIPVTLDWLRKQMASKSPQ